MGSPVILSYDVFFPILSKKAPLLVLHGLLGSKGNWRSLAKLLPGVSGREVYTLDARNHGDSPHTRDFNYHVMADDVRYFGQHKGFRNFSLMGHSMGGRTAMLLALTQPETVERLIVVDISPVSMPSSSSVIANYLEIMKEVVNILPSHCSLAAGRKHADKYMEKFIPEPFMRNFLLMNLKKHDSGFCWKINIDAIKNYFGALQCFPSVSTTFKKDALFICGENSTYVKEEDYEKILELFPRSQFVRIPKADHWVHNDRPDEFFRKLNEFI